MIIAGVDNINKNSYIYSLISLKYEISISFAKIFKHMNEILILIQMLFKYITVLHYGKIY